MYQNKFNQYLETEVLTADPVKLINMLYRGALESIASARRHLASAEIPERSRQITKAWEIVRELGRSLDKQKGGEMARSLSELYAYIQERLIDANARQADEPLAEAERLLNTLAEAWKLVAPAMGPPPAVQQTYARVSCRA